VGCVTRVYRLQAAGRRGAVVSEHDTAGSSDRQRGMADVEVAGAARGDADDPGLDRRDEVVLPGLAAVAGNEDVVVDLSSNPGTLPGVRVSQGALREIDRAVGCDVAIAGIDVLARIAELGLAPGVAGVMRLGDPRISAGRAVEGGVNVLSVVAHGDDRLVVLFLVSVGLEGIDPLPVLIDLLLESYVESDHEHRVDVHRVRD